MSRPSTYESVRWSEADMIHELEVLLGSVLFSYNGSKSRELREMYDRRLSILKAVLATFKSNMTNVWEVRARAHQQASEAKDAEITRLESALAAEREKVATLTDRVRGLEGALQPLVPNQHGDYGGPLVAGKWWFEDGSEQVISSDNGIKAANALTPPAPAGPVTLKPGHDHDDNDPYMPAPAKAAREGEAQT